MHMDPDPATWNLRSAYKVTRWYHLAWWRFKAWFKRVILRRKPSTMTVTAIDKEHGIITLDGHPPNTEPR